MRTNIYRTHRTELSDAELVLLDVLFDCCASFACLRHQGFRERFNYCSHELDDSSLANALQLLCDRNVLQVDASDQDVVYGLTKRGGDLWSLERCPIWSRFATERYDETKSGKPMVTIVATTLHTLSDILAAGNDLGMWGLDRMRVRQFEIRKHSLIPWHPFPNLHVAVAIGGHWYSEYDHSACETRRSWWRIVRELQKFLVDAG